MEERIKRIARVEDVDLQRLRRQVAFDRFLARLFQSGPADWVLKGGYAMELRFHRARTTRDLDFTLRMKPAGGDDAILAILQNVGGSDLGEWFVFRASQATTLGEKAIHRMSQSGYEQGEECGNSYHILSVLSLQSGCYLSQATAVWHSIHRIAGSRVTEKPVCGSLYSE